MDKNKFDFIRISQIFIYDLKIKSIISKETYIVKFMKSKILLIKYFLRVGLPNYYFVNSFSFNNKIIIYFSILILCHFQVFNISKFRHIKIIFFSKIITWWD
jgi:hypothetical protein